MLNYFFCLKCWFKNKFNTNKFFKTNAIVSIWYYRGMQDRLIALINKYKIKLKQYPIGYLA